MLIRTGNIGNFWRDFPFNRIVPGSLSVSVYRQGSSLLAVGSNNLKHTLLVHSCLSQVYRPIWVSIICQDVLCWVFKVRVQHPDTKVFGRCELMLSVCGERNARQPDARERTYTPCLYKFVFVRTSSNFHQFW